MLSLPKCGECDIYSSLFCPYKDPNREHCVFAPMLTEFFATIANYMAQGTPFDVQEICVKYIEKLNHEEPTR